MRKTGECYLYDLGSTHKTFINRTAVIPRKYAKLKSGDLITFGMSTRLYYLQGGPEEDVKPINVPITSNKQEEVKKPVPLSKTEKQESESNFIQQILQSKRDQKEEFSLRALYDDDDDEYDQDEEDYTILKKTIDALRDDEDDDFYDRTGRSKKKSRITITDTYETLLSKKNMLEKIRNTLNLESLSLRKIIKEQEEMIEGKEYDDLDDYISSRDRHSAEEESLKRKQWLIKEIEQELKDINKLIEKAKPIDGTKSLLKLTKKMKQQVLAYLKVYMDKYEKTNIKSNNKKRKYTFDDLLKKPEDTSYEKKEEKEEEEEKETKEDKIKNNDPFADFKVIKDDGGSYNNNVSKRIKKTVPDFSDKFEEVPLSSLNDDNETKKDFIPDNLGKVQRKRKQPIIQYDDENVNYDSWAPPPNQTGDGRTHLNDKYGY